ncbi:CRISPR-associated endonuclease Cas3'' [Corallococcus silvisoli]|uniref:CRISPR-associated endonuclease Cas3'' n=1 Tax=Corallococcus silvisoli TaxID=2697031 RepID=UPI001F181616|nr:CRISPR-associated endonuclease Cas3'' [Corallococcus silvisoli]
MPPLLCLGGILSDDANRTSADLSAWAHVDARGRPHLLEEHLEQVGELAGRFARRFQSEGFARLAGRWHDLGKYTVAFQNLIRRENGLEAHLEQEGPVGPRDHSTAGALHAREVLGGELGTPLAFVIAGHHAGLANAEALADRLQQEPRQRLYAQVLSRPVPEALLRAEGTLVLPEFLATRPSSPRELKVWRRRMEVWTRMLFSALCDADFLDTEAFFNAERAALRGESPAIPVLRDRLSRHLEALGERVRAQGPLSEVNRVRAEVLEACLAKAEERPGVFSLTVPTGGGKTLASMAFALEHAARHGLERVVVAIPFTSIIEQNAAVYAEALGGDAVLEHHSGGDPERETARNRVAAENWDRPVVVTTTAQLFDSLFANRPGACRKLHRLAGSVIVLDEAQTLPPGLLAPILDVLRTLVSDHGASVVICTATQPALGQRPGLAEGFEQVREILPDPREAFRRLRRVRVRWPAEDEPWTPERLAEDLAGESSVLAIVHRRDDARRTCEALDARLGDKRTIHLSALMCPAHRSDVLEKVRVRRVRGESVRLVATQLVEAGVDLDFPVVYRALGGLDALAQAAGRCNREGRLDRLGELRVFLSSTEPPPGVPSTALGVTRELLGANPELELFEPSTFAAYFKRLYGSKSLDAKGIQEQRERLRFRETAERFQLIEDGWSAPLVVPYGESSAWVAELEREGPSRDRLRWLQRYTVNVSRRQRDDWLARGCARWVAETVVVLGEGLGAAYSKRLGLVPERVGTWSPTALLVDG